jgi:predicted transcriptional regulator
MARKTKILITDPALVDFLSENKIAFEILRVVDKLASEKSQEWIKVPDILKELRKLEEYDKPKLRSTVHYYCRRLHERYEALDRYKGQDKNDRPVYYRITDKGEAHLRKMQSDRETEVKGSEK